jgi:pyridoxal phosphate enzyme (YggS family)
MSIAENIARVREQIGVAARRAARSPNPITLMAVTKTVPPQAIREAYAAGIRSFGENRVQEFAAKADPLRDLSDARWHMIGHLQGNKARGAVERFDAVDSVDSLRLARKLDLAAAGLVKKMPVLIEINIAGEASKSGLTPDSSEFDDLLLAAPEFRSLDFQGLMTVPPYREDPEDSRPYFRRMRELFEEIQRRRLPLIQMNVLSMGMSHDFQVALEEGATCVRLGTAIFGERPAVRSER